MRQEELTHGFFIFGLDQHPSMRASLIYALLLMLTAPALAQLTPGDLPGIAPGYTLKAPLQGLPSQATAIWTEDFASGIPEDWLTDDLEGAAHWEYRGPATTPDNTVGSQGSCSWDGVNGDPLLSPTVDNGFVIFDSNFWDDPIGPCGNFDNGEDPGPHFAALTTHSFDLSDFNYVALKWTHFYTQWINNSVAYAEVSVDGGDWNLIWEAEIATGFATPMDEEVILDLSSIAGGFSEVQIRWVFDGEYYWWMLDDIEVYELPLYDMGVEALTYSNFDPFNTSTGDFTGLEYSIYPDEMQGPIRPRADVRNMGAQTQTDLLVNFTIEHVEESAIVYDNDGDIEELFAQELGVATGSTFSSPSTIGHYELRCAAGTSPDDPSPANNNAVRKFKVADAEYARDTLAMDGQYIPGENFYNLDWEQGNIFMITGQDQDAESIMVGLAEGSNNAGTEVVGRIYHFSLAGGVTADLVAETQAVPASAENFNTYGEGAMMILPFDSPVTLVEDSAYAVVAGNVGGANNLWYAHSGDSPDYSSWVNFEDGDWYFLPSTPMVRLNFGVVDDIEEFSKPSAVSGAPYPVPASGEIFFPLDLTAPSELCLTWCDMQGRSIKQECLFAAFKGEGDVQARVPTQPGVYSVRVQLDGAFLASHSVLIR